MEPSREKVPIGAQTDIPVAGFLFCQLHQPKGVCFKNKAARSPQQALVYARLSTQASRVQALPLQRVYQLTD
ncbi:hypothetical protein D3C81_2247360 [compost metagenome]